MFGLITAKWKKISETIIKPEHMDFKYNFQTIFNLKNRSMTVL